MHLKEIEIQYFAILREQRGAGREILATAASTPADLYAEVARHYHFSLRQDQLRVAVNDAFAGWQTPLNDKDQVVFLPPVSGG